MNQRVKAVRLPSFSIAEMMAIIALVGLDCLAIRMGSPLTLYSVTFGGLPMQIVLVIGLLLLLRLRRRKERQLPFLIGFEVVGWLGHLIFVAVCVQAAVSLDMHMVHALSPLLAVTGFQTHAAVDLIWRIALGMSYLTALQLVPALVGGLISQWWSKRTQPETMPTHD